MRLILGVGLAALLLPGAASGAPVPAGDFHARLRANDAPLGGRFTVRAYALDTLATAVELPGPGRLVILNVREANGDDSFLIPGDFGIQGDRTVWMRGFQPLGEGPFEGLLGKRDSRWALWWVPWESDSLVWSSFEGIRLAYGIWTAPFTSLDAEDAAEVRASVPWELLRDVRIDPERPASLPTRFPDPAAFDEPPSVRRRVDPMYPRFSRQFDFHGTVHVAAQVDAKGRVVDAYVIQSTAFHQLNVASLVAAMDWVFLPGKKQDRWVGGDIVIPMTFTK